MRSSSDPEREVEILSEKVSELEDKVTDLEKERYDLQSKIDEYKNALADIESTVKAHIRWL